MVETKQCGSLKTTSQFFAGSQPDGPGGAPVAKGRKRLTFSAQLTEEHRCERTFYSRGSPWRSAEDTAELATEPQQEHKGQGKENERAERNWQDVPGAFRAVVAKMGARLGDVAVQRRCVAVFVAHI